MSGALSKLRANGFYAPALPGQWFGGAAPLVNPADGDVLVDSGALENGQYNIGVHGTFPTAGIIDIQYRNAANTTTKQFIRRSPSGDVDIVLATDISVLDNERIRVVAVGAIVGTVQLSLLMKEIQ